jgi:glucans biosynthesis protein C
MDIKSILETPGRLYYVDWVRVLAMVCVFFFHNARFFDAFSDWHVRNLTTNLGASALVAFLSQWMMPLFFLISGASTYYALKNRSAGKYGLERVLRLLVPMVIGMLVIVVPQVYFEALSHGKVVTGNFFQIYYRYLIEVLPGLNFYHLWFLVDLFVFSIIFLPLFVDWGKGNRGILTRIADRIAKPYLFIPLFILALAILDIFVFPGGYWGNRDTGNWSVIAYGLFFILGYVMFANPHIMETVKKLAWVFLGAAVIAMVLILVFFTDTLTDRPASFGSGTYTLAMLLESVNTWCWILAILGLAAKYLNKSTRFLNYANEAVLPFYILHQTLIIVIGYYVVQWNTGIGLKYLTTTITSFIAIMAIYELLVRRINTVRFLFGMKLKKGPRE